MPRIVLGAFFGVVLLVGTGRSLWEREWLDAVLAGGLAAACLGLTYRVARRHLRHAVDGWRRGPV